MGKGWKGRKTGVEGGLGKLGDTIFPEQSLVSNGAKLEMHFLCSYGVQRNKFNRRQIAHVYRFVMLYMQHTLTHTHHNTHSEMLLT